ncbi:MAG: hypothetical protein Kow00122_12340 [Thermoleophilia bacterium]
MNTVLLVMIVLPLVVVAVGLVVVIRQGYRLYKTGMAVRAEVEHHTRVILEKQAAAAELADRITQRQTLLAERLPAAAEAVGRLVYLLSEYNQAKTRLASLE